MRFIADGLLWSDEQMLGFITRMQKIFASGRWNIIRTGSF